MEHEIFGQFGMDNFEVINSKYTPKGFQTVMSTPLWKGGQCLRDWKGDALPDFGEFETDESRKPGLLGLALHQLLS